MLSLLLPFKQKGYKKYLSSLASGLFCEDDADSFFFSSDSLSFDGPSKMNI